MKNFGPEFFKSSSPIARGTREPLGKRHPLVSGPLHSFVFRGITCFYLKTGTGKPMVFLHNAGTSHELWEHQISYFAQTHTCYALDLPGYGSSSREQAQTSLAFYTDMLDHFLRTAQVTSPTLIGNCLGSAISLNYTISQFKNSGAGAGTVEKLILFHLLTPKTAEAGILKPLFLMTEPVRASRRLLRGALSPFRLPRSIARFAVDCQLGSRMQLSPDCVSSFINDLQRKRVLSALGDLFVDIDSYKKLDLYEMGSEFPKVMMVWGTENRILPLKAGQEYSQRSKVQDFRMVNGGGHLVMHELADEVNPLIKEFIEKNSRKDDLVC